MAREIAAVARKGKPRKGRKGFEHATKFMTADIRRIGEARGFAESRLLTRWPEIAGEAIATCTKPAKVSYAKGAFGATLTLQVSGARAPEIQMQTDWLRERINACYGYAAISRIRLVQASAEGFAEPVVGFEHEADEKPDEEDEKRIAEQTQTVRDPELREQMQLLGRNVKTTGKRKGIKKS